MATIPSKPTVSLPILLGLLCVVGGLVVAFIYIRKNEDSTDTVQDTAVASPTIPTPEPEATVPATLSNATFVPKTLEDTTCSDQDGTYLWDKNQGVLAVSVPVTVSADASEEQELVDARAAVGAYLKKSPASDLKKLGVDVDPDYKVTDISSFPNIAFATSCFGINLLEAQRLNDIPAVGTRSAAVIAAEDSGGIEGVLDGNRVAYLFVEDGGRYYMLRRAAYSTDDWQKRITSYMEACDNEGKTDELASPCVSDKLTGDQEVASKLHSVEEQLVKDFPNAKAATLKK